MHHSPYPPRLIQDIGAKLLANRLEFTVCARLGDCYAYLRLRHIRGIGPHTHLPGEIR